MQERLEAFSGGIKVKWESIFGSEGKIIVNKPPRINKEQFKEFLLDCKQECFSCPLSKNKSCSGLNSDGEAHIKVGNGDVINDALEENQTPCNKNGIKCSPF